NGLVGVHIEHGQGLLEIVLYNPPSRLDVRAEAVRRLQGTATRARTARAGGRRSAGDGETPRAGRGRVSEGCSMSIPAHGRDGPYQLRAGGRPSARALELRAAERRGRWSGRGAPQHRTGPGYVGGE